MRLTFTVTGLDGATRTVEAGFSAQVRYEEIAGRTLTSWRSDAPGVRDWAILAWVAETGEDTPFRVWTDSVEMVTLTGTIETDPTRPVPEGG